MIINNKDRGRICKCNIIKYCKHTHTKKKEQFSSSFLFEKNFHSNRFPRLCWRVSWWKLDYLRLLIVKQLILFKADQTYNNQIGHIWAKSIFPKQKNFSLKLMCFLIHILLLFICFILCCSLFPLSNLLNNSSL
jgi:hypothetical protein